MLIAVPSISKHPFDPVQRAVFLGGFDHTFAQEPEQICGIGWGAVDGAVHSVAQFRHIRNRFQHMMKIRGACQNRWHLMDQCLERDGGGLSDHHIGFGQYGMDAGVCYMHTILGIVECVDRVQFRGLLHWVWFDDYGAINTGGDCRSNQRWVIDCGFNGSSQHFNLFGKMEC